MKNAEKKYSISESLSTFKESEFVTEGLLGEGAVGKVSLGTLNGGNDKIAVKYVSGDVSEEAFIREVNLLEKAKHPNIIPILGVMDSKLQGFPYALVTPYMDDGSLYHLLKNGVPMSWEFRLNIAIDIARGLMHMHALKILHGDLKALNILINNQSEVKIADFGCAIEFKDAKKVIGTDFGTKLWQAPELYYGLPILTEESDIYSFGVILGELVTGKIPEFNNNLNEVIARKKQGSDNQNFHEPAEIEAKKLADNADKIFGRTLWDISQACQSVKPEDRPDLQSIIHILTATRTYAKEYVTGKDEIENSTPLFRDSTASTSIRVPAPDNHAVLSEVKLVGVQNSTLWSNRLFPAPVPADEEKNDNDDKVALTCIQNSSLVSHSPNLVILPNPKSIPPGFGKYFVSFFKSFGENTRKVPAHLYSEETQAALMVFIDFIEQTRGMTT